MPAPTAAKTAPDESTRFVEDAGLLFEEIGLPRMSGRMLGHLLICDPPHQTARQLAEALHASAGSVSASSRLLISTGLVERTTFPGDRRDYFVACGDRWSEVLTARLGWLSSFRRLIARGMTLVGEDAAATRLLEADEFLAFFEDEFVPELQSRWEARRTRPRR